MLAPLCTTPHKSMRQIRIKTQNMIVLTLEFTRTPLPGEGETQLASATARITF
jgi:hypothetical protein